MRQTPYACAGFAFVFDEVYEFGAGETITQRYRLVIANGGWDAAQVGGVAGAWREVEAGYASTMRGSGVELDEGLGSLTMSLCLWVFAQFLLIFYPRGKMSRAN